MGKSTISMAIFNRYISSPEGTPGKNSNLAEEISPKTCQRLLRCFCLTLWLWLTGLAMENHHAIFIGKASISIRATEKPWQTVSHNQRIDGTFSLGQGIVPKNCREKSPKKMPYKMPQLGDFSQKDAIIRSTITREKHHFKKMPLDTPPATCFCGFHPGPPWSVSIRTPCVAAAPSSTRRERNDSWSLAGSSRGNSTLQIFK